MKLTVELVPATSWGNNVRSELSREQWDVIRRKCYRKANYVCEICGGVGPRHPVECHEIWDYNDKTHVQKLVGFVALCPNCHRVKHLGRTFSVGFGKQAIIHLATVNGISTDAAAQYTERVFAQWQERSRHSWIVDISYIEEYIGSSE